MAWFKSTTTTTNAKSKTVRKNAPSSSSSNKYGIMNDKVRTAYPNPKGPGYVVKKRLSNGKTQNRKIKKTFKTKTQAKQALDKRIKKK